MTQDSNIFQSSLPHSFIGKKLAGIRRRLSSRRAFSLIELLVTMAISSVMVVAIVSSYSVQKGSSEAEAGILEMRLNARLAMSHVSRIIRSAGVGCLVNFFNAPSDPGIPVSLQTLQGAVGVPFDKMFTPSNGAPGASDQLTVITGFKPIATVVGQPNMSGDPVKVTLSNIYTMNDEPLFDTTYNSNIFFAPSARNNFLKISSVAVGTSEVYVDTPGMYPDFNISPGSQVFRINAYRITLDQDGDIDLDVDGDGNATDEDDGDEYPDLYVFNNTSDLDGDEVNSFKIAQGIETIQFQYGWDQNNDGVINDGTEWFDDPLAADPTNELRIRAVRIFILARTLKPDAYFRDVDENGDLMTYQVADQLIQVVDNGDNYSEPFDQHFHRYLLVETVMVRNRNL